ncbi:charged multivesicular body 5-like [Babesia ovis]|uniref:thiol oxidase n=1 Tax=Babesia ovis TaxID=5869 RepID=A0A9W5TET3_BABOV|nr:charged multivesicular body 5-like [Babesia ovis]
MSSNPTSTPSERRKYTFAESLDAVDRNTAIDPCSAQWLLIWMYGAYVDDAPTDSQRRNISVFYRTLTDMCNNGQQCFQRFVSEFPPQTDSRRAILGWVQMAENSCRIQNGLPPRLFKFFRKSNTGPSIQETSQQLDTKLASIDEKIKGCNAELARIKAALGVTKSAGAVAAAKRKASQVLQRRRVYETQRDQLVGVQLAVDQCDHISSQVKTAVDIRNALSASVKATRKQLKQVNMNDLERLQEEVEDLQDYAAEINDTFDGRYSNNDALDEDELEFEFATLEDPEDEISSGVGSSTGIIQRVKDTHVGISIPSPPKYSTSQTEGSGDKIRN